MTVRLAMKFSEIELSSISSYIKSPSHVIEQKMDGTRTLVVIRDGRVDFLGQGGKPLTHAAAKLHFEKLAGALHHLMPVGDPGELVLDGEILIGDGTLHLFDLPYFRHAGLEWVRPDMGYRARREYLDGPLKDELRQGGPVYVVPSAQTEYEKATLWERANREGVEGVMIKHVDGTYEPGNRTKNGLKAKFVKTADVVVTSVNRPDAKHGSCTFAIAVPDGSDQDGPFTTMRMQGVGGCSLIGKPHVEVGDVIEVAYLYWTGDSLYQPRMLRVRTDKAAHECGLDQLPAYSRAAL